MINEVVIEEIRNCEPVVVDKRNVLRREGDQVELVPHSFSEEEEDYISTIVKLTESRMRSIGCGENKKQSLNLCITKKIINGKLIEAASTYTSDDKYNLEQFMSTLYLLYSSKAIGWQKKKVKLPGGAFVSGKKKKENFLGMLDQTFYYLVKCRNMELFLKVKELLYPEVKSYVLERYLGLSPKMQQLVSQGSVLGEDAKRHVFNGTEGHITVDEIVDTAFCRLFAAMFYISVAFEYQYAEDDVKCFDDAVRKALERLEKNKGLLVTVLQFIDRLYFQNAFKKKMIKEGKYTNLQKEYTNYMQSLSKSDIKVDKECYNIEYILKYVI